MFALILIGLIIPTVNQFSEEINQIFFFPLLILSIVLLIIGSIVAIKDKEFFHFVTDERTRKVDRSAGYYSWWFTLIFVFLFGAIATIEEFKIFQFVGVILSAMFLSMLLFHMYFYFKGEE